MRLLKQITALLLTLQVSYCKEANKIDGTTAADNFTMSDTYEQLKLFLAEDVLDNDTHSDMSKRRMSSLKRFIMKTFEDQQDIMNRLSDDLTDLQLKVDAGVSARDKTNPKPNCEWDNNDKPECVPSSCTEAFQESSESSVYKVKPLGTDVKSFPVYCLKDNASGDPWLVIQRRTDGKLDFDRTWHDYKLGFGNLDSEFWLGMDKIYALTNSARYELRVTIINWDGNSYVAYYNGFLLSDEASNYTLTIGEWMSGTASDALKVFQGGAMWSTKDVDNDSAELFCAPYYGGGWWFRHCTWSNLNGRFPPKDEKFKAKAMGIYWGSMQNVTYKSSEMAMRVKREEP